MHLERMREKAAEGRRTRMLVAGMVAVVVAMATSALALSSCAPKSRSEAPNTSGDTSSVSADGADFSSFTDNDAGMYPDTDWNENYLNAGHRGCNSCHADLEFTIENSHLAADHPLVKSGNTSNGRNVTVLDGCLSCHDVHTADYGNYFADAIHNVHYSSEGFTDTLKGNCWSCHAVTDSSGLTNIGNTDMVLWEQVMYDGGLGGYPDASQSSATRDFLKMQGHDSGYVTDVGAQGSPDIKVDMDQAVSDEDDAYVALNHAGKHSEDDLYDTDHTVTIEGVNNPQTFTYDQLKAMPQTTERMTNQCVVAGAAGHDIYNDDWTGVSLNYLVQLCGGLVDGANVVHVTAWDEWENTGINLPVNEYLDKGIVALQLNGHDIQYELGGPIRLMSPGVGGAFNTSFVKDIDFTHSDTPSDFVNANKDTVPGDELNPVSAAWFQNDGETFKLGDPVQLTGYAYAYATHVAPLKTIEFSTDLGATWKDVQVPDGFDPYQWVTFNFQWTPDKAGTYIVKVRGVNANGDKSDIDGSIIVNVVDGDNADDGQDGQD